MISISTCRFAAMSLELQRCWPCRSRLSSRLLGRPAMAWVPRRGVAETSRYRERPGRKMVDTETMSRRLVIIETFIPPTNDSPAWTMVDRYFRLPKLLLRERLVSWLNLSRLKGEMKALGEKWSRPVFLQKATEAYKQYNTAYAGGDRNLLSYVATPSMLDSLLTSLKQRERVKSGGAPEKMLWSLVKELEPPRIASTRLIAVDIEQTQYLAQVVVRFHTMQKVDIANRQGFVTKEGSLKDILDYVIFERRLWESKREGWLISAKAAESPFPLRKEQKV